MIFLNVNIVIKNIMRNSMKSMTINPDLSSNTLLFFTMRRLINLNKSPMRI